MDIGKVPKSKDEAEENEEFIFELDTPELDPLFGDRGDLLSTFLLVKTGEARDSDNEDAESEIL